MSMSCQQSELPMFTQTPAERFSQLRFPGRTCNAAEAHAYLVALFEYHPAMQGGATLWCHVQSVLTDGTELYVACGVEAALHITGARPGTHHLYILEKNWSVILGSNGNYKQPVLKGTVYYLIQDGTIINQNKVVNQNKENTQ